jgi:hypothetical protein
MLVALLTMGNIFSTLYEMGTFAGGAPGEETGQQRAKTSKVTRNRERLAPQ